MEILKSEQYVGEKLNIKPVSKDRLAELCKEPEVDDKTRQFIENNNLVWNPSTRCYDGDGDVRISKNIVFDGKLKIRFGKVKGYFNCSHNKLKTLECAPQEVGGYFDCSNNELTTLEGAPHKVGENFDCRNSKLTTLKGAPLKVGGYFDCFNNNLTTLEGAPQEVGDYFDCSNNKLTTLEGAPHKVGGYFDCSINKLTNLNGAPQEVSGDLYCGRNPNLVLPKNKPSWVKGEIIQ